MGSVGSNKIVSTSNIQELFVLEEKLLKKLIRKAAISTPAKLLQRSEQMVNKIILESDVDGVQYYLVHSRLHCLTTINLSPRE